ncbi:DNA primase [Corynebacterium macginleyi]|uniref:DNA primase n=1 Tax=Corynebacterium macginleyi TaxID=38290 RepID=A0A3M0G1M6_9CORY|nr:DNA primase [Corynebacterium macginleyi]MBK4140315.1 DNA primase [Corynebacterium macginleyi]MBK4144681.1 DNA primase [Corynebacterium macginleyi]MBK4152748.1 DNA primase [Corynebacterium macginleyi]MBK4156438.1 DNA primase [Corynebacterium macginleyi]MBK4164686.1 DNA primase [Corynebacterium macginleyi]
MSFFEDIASALDAEGIESRVNEDVMFVPITSDLEIQFVEIDPLLPAANVYIAAADVDEDDEEFEAVLVSVAFSVEDAVEAVSRHIATDQVVTVLRDLLEGTDERIAELEFDQDEFNPHLVVADVGNDSELRVLVETIDGVPSAIVRFLAFDLDEEDIEELEDEAVKEFWQVDEEGDDLDENERLALLGNTDSGDIPIVEVPAETLELGTYTDFDRLFDVLSLVSEQALDWEAQLVNFDEGDFEEPDVYDIFGEDADDEDDEDLEFFDTFTEDDDADVDDESDND